MELNLDLSVFCSSNPLSGFLRNVCPSSLLEIQGFLDKLEEEKKKVDVFKRELPLCMVLLNEAIGRLQEEAKRFAEPRDVLEKEGSVASKRKFEEERGKNVENDKSSWMSSAQLWISNSDSEMRSAHEEEEEEEEDGSAPQKAYPSCNFGNEGGVFLPFTSPFGDNHPPPPLNLMTPPASDMVMNYRVEERQLSKPQNCNLKKEQRRRWSPELHRKFLDALQILGGSRAATPKQIRELMQVEGLTNDEVKSHLQKFRIHVRKHPLFTAGEIARTGGSDQITCGNVKTESQSVFELDSPQGPLARREFSSNGGHSSETVEDDDMEAKSDGHSCRTE